MAKKNSTKPVKNETSKLIPESENTEVLGRLARAAEKMKLYKKLLKSLAALGFKDLGFPKSIADSRNDLIQIDCIIYGDDIVNNYSNFTDAVEKNVERLFDQINARFFSIK